MSTRPADYYVIHYTVRVGVDPEDMWAEAQAHDAYIKFNGFGDVIFTLDQRNPYNTLFAVKYSDNFSTIVREGYYDWEYRRDL